ncbi:hypothetical protein C7B76_30055, partial [filamentous cyanobacterium CCP2]
GVGSRKWGVDWAGKMLALRNLKHYTSNCPQPTSSVGVLGDAAVLQWGFEGTPQGSVRQNLNLR